MGWRLAIALVIGGFVLSAMARDESDCPSRTLINNGVCRDKNGDCSKQLRSRICYDTEPRYTDEAVKANIKGTVKLQATIQADGCAYDIKVTTPLGYGLDEAAISAVERFRFRKPSKPTPVHVEFKFDPQLSSRAALTEPACVERRRTAEK